MSRRHRACICIGFDAVALRTGVERVSVLGHEPRRRKSIAGITARFDTVVLGSLGANVRKYTTVMPQPRISLSFNALDAQASQPTPVSDDLRAPTVSCARRGRRGSPGVVRGRPVGAAKNSNGSFDFVSTFPLRWVRFSAALVRQGRCSNAFADREGERGSEHSSPLSEERSAVSTGRRLCDSQSCGDSLDSKSGALTTRMKRRSPFECKCVHSNWIARH